MVFCLGCLKKTLLPLVAIALLVSIGQLVLIFINNRVFGAIMFVLHILFFLAILVALCRDSVSMYAASAVLLIIFVLGCTLIQAYAVDVRDLLSMSTEESKAVDTGKGSGGGDEPADVGSTTAGSSGEGTTESSGSTKGARKRDLYQLSIPEPQWKPPDPVTSWEAPEDILPVYPANPSQIPVAFIPSNQVPFLQTIIFQPAPTLPPPPSAPVSTVLSTAPKVSTSLESQRNARFYGPKGRWRSSRGDNDKPAKSRKFRWRNELRWVSNALGVLHILILAVIICILYEMLFGGCYRYRTWW